MIDIEQANETAVSRMMEARPILKTVATARDVIPGMRDNLLLHAGPPITWERASGPMRGAIVGALIFEGLATDWDSAAKLVTSGEIDLEPCHEHDAVGPMAGVTSASMEVYVIENVTHGNTAYSNLNEGYGKVLRYGAFGEEVYRRLRWMEQTLYPALKRAIERVEGGIDLRALISQALHMGDECHNRNRAGTSLLLRVITPHLMATSPPETAKAVFEFIDSNDHFFLNLSMPAAKAMTEAAEGPEMAGSSIITTRGIR